MAEWVPTNFGALHFEKQVTVRPMLWDRCPVCLSVTLVHCGLTVRWIRIPLGTEVVLGPGDIVLDGTHPPRKGAQQPPPRTFWPMCLVAKRRPLQLLLSSCLVYAGHPSHRRALLNSTKWKSKEVRDKIPGPTFISYWSHICKSCTAEV